MAVSTASHQGQVAFKGNLPYESDKTFDFQTKTKFTSEKASRVRRSLLHQSPAEAFRYDVWTLQPPNFNAQAFEPRPVKRNTREAVRPWTYDRLTEYKDGTAPNAAQRRRSDRRMKEYFRMLEEQRSAEEESGGSEEEERRRAKTCGELETRGNFQVRFHRVDPYEAKIEFVKHGRYPSGPYQMPQPHDFRQYPSLKTLGLDEFATSYQRDCMGLDSKKRGLRTLIGQPVDVLRNVPFRTKSEYAIPRPLKWDNQLILPKLPFPNKNAGFTRHTRTDRSARSAYLERAEAMMEKRKKEIQEFKEKFERQSQALSQSTAA